MSSRPVLAALFVLAAASGARAVPWLTASSWSTRPGDEVSLTESEGNGFAGDPVAPRLHRLVLRGTEERDLEMSRSGDSLATFLVEDDGGALVGAQTEPVIVPMTDAELDAQAFDEHLATMTRMRRGSARPGRERRVSCETAWIDGGDARRVRRGLGLDLELVPLRNPSRASTPRIQLLFRKRPLSGAMVSSWRHAFEDDGSVPDARTRQEAQRRSWSITDARGIVRLDDAPAGAYLVTASHAVPCRDPNAAEWEHWDASLTFTRPGSWGSRTRSSEPHVLRGTGLGTNPDLGPVWTGSTSLRDRPGWGRH